MSDSPRGPHGPAQPSRPILSQGFGPLLKLIRDAKPPYGLMAAGLVFSLVTTAAGLVVPLFTKSLVDGFSVQSLDPSTVVLIVGAFLLQAVGGALAGYALYYSSLKVVASVRQRLWDQYLRLPVSVFDAKPAGDLASRMTNDTAVLQNLVADQFPGFVTGILSALVGVGFLFWLDWQMSLVAGNEKLWTQVWTNLLSNAVKFTPEGGRITVRMASGPPLTVEVEDSGIGLAPGEADRVLGRFYKAESSRTHADAVTGSGLGTTARVVFGAPHP